jgi:3-oxoacyl-[acyl-carrier protein] reductase
VTQTAGGGWAAIEQLAIGQEATLRERITADLIASTARITGDDNPVHLDASVAAAFGHSRPVAHGLILLGLISRLIGTRLPGPGSIWFDHQLEFLAPVYDGDEVEVTVRVAHVSPANRVVVLDVIARRVGGIDIARGRAKVRIPQRVYEERTPMADCDKVAVVTGGSRGVGRAVAEALGTRAMRVVINYRQDRTGADASAAAVRERGGQALTIAADVSRADGGRELIDRSVEEFGRVDVIVHCATPAVEYREWSETGAEEFRAYFDTYVIGLHELARLAVPGMKERRYGRIVGVLSSAIAEVPARLSAYVAGKYALHGLCRALAVELGPWNITVNTISPGMLVGDQADRAGLAVREAVARKTPLRRLGQPGDVARAIAFLVSEDAAFITGANLPVTGGVFV